MASTNILTNLHHYNGAKLLKEEIETGNNTYYFFVGDSQNYTNNTIQEVDGSINDIDYQVRKNMLFGKKLNSNNVFLGIRNVPYEDNKIFDQYDDQTDLTDLDYYCIVNASSYSHVFKCLDNNNGANSTVAPDFSEIVGANTQLYRVADGYCWKYMYSVDGDTISKFKTPEYFPCIANNEVSNSAIFGSINIVKINDGGKLYNNYTTGHFSVNDIKVDSNTVVYQLSNSLSQAVNSYYTGCILYMTSGTSIGQYKTISDHIANTTGNFIVIDSVFSTTPTNGDNYEIYPGVNFQSDTTQTVNAIARALVNSTSSNSIFRIEVLNSGQGYYSANASVTANAVVGVTLSANIRPILSPIGGHGYNVYKELDARTLLISASLANSESNTIPTSNKFQQIGIIKNPLFANTNLTLDGATTVFTAGETAYYINSVAAVSNCSTNSQNKTVIGSNTSLFTYQFQPNTKIMLHDIDNTLIQLATINNVVNNFTLELTANNTFTSNNIAIYWPNIQETIKVIDINSTNEIVIANNLGKFTTGSVIVGETSGAYAIVNSVSRNDVSKYFDTFVEVNKYNITTVSGTFIEDEEIKQGNTSGYVFSSNSSVLYGYNLKYPIVTGINIIGQSSGAIASVTKVFPKEIIQNSGEIQYLENIEPITRQNNQTETFKLAIKF